MYSLEEILNQAIKDEKGVVSEMPIGFNIISKGIKIKKFSDRIEILDMNRGGDYYKEIDPLNYKIFYEQGWKIGCLRMAIINCVFKLKLIEEKIKTEVNTRKNDKHIQNLKNKRERILIKYTTNKNKLNSINNK
tara:strand:+ start:686 stop:1087 length:402 start_codon:yes stop_codon:yes gene_type:complete